MVPEELGSYEAVNRLSVDIPSSDRVSMEEEYQNRSPEPGFCTAGGSVESPPSYDADALLQLPYARRKFNIQPREDEGRETLPPYSSEISLENIFMRKMELEGPVHRAQDRNWYRTYVTLQGTALTIHKCKPSGYFSGWSSESMRTDVASESKKGQFLRSYNLQHADVGIAADYYKKRHVIRVRAETDQFLISCYKIETFVHWLQFLFAAIDLAPPLDDRSLPRDLSIPRPHRRRTSSNLSNMESNTTLVREQQEIIHSQFPSLAEGEISEGESMCPNSPSAAGQEPWPTSSADTIAPIAPIATSPRTTQSATALTISYAPPHFQSSLETSQTHPSISPETGKWRPEHHWTATYDMIYAKRCMAILTCRSPRKSNLIIMKGKQWIVDWATGVLTRVEPPDYGEIVGQKGTLIVGPFGEAARA